MPGPVAAVVDKITSTLKGKAQAEVPKADEVGFPRVCLAAAMHSAAMIGGVSDHAQPPQTVSTAPWGRRSLITRASAAVQRGGKRGRGGGGGWG